MVCWSARSTSRRRRPGPAARRLLASASALPDPRTRPILFVFHIICGLARRKDAILEYMTFCSQSCAANEAGKHRVEERAAEEKPSCSTTTRPLWDRSATESVTETPPRPADRLDMANILSTRRCRLSRPPQIYISLHSYTYPFFPSILLFIHPHLRNDVQVLRSRAGAHLECPFGFRWRGHGLWRCEPGAYHLYDLLDDPSLYYLVVAGAQRRIGRVDARTCDLSDLSDQTRSLGQTSSHSFVSFFQVNRTGRNACGFNPKSLGKQW